jgi:hypothetical protein
MTGVVVSKTIYRGLLGNSAAGVVLWLFKLCMYIYTVDRSSRVKLSMADPRSIRACSSSAASTAVGLHTHVRTVVVSTAGVVL